MTILYGWYLTLAQIFGVAGAAMVLIYGGIIAALLVSIMIAAFWRADIAAERLEAIAASQEGRHRVA